MNTEVLFSSKTDLHTTPDDLFDQLNKEFNFDLDAAADTSNHKCSEWLGEGGGAPDALMQPWEIWGDRIWCNPPYGRGTKDWLERAWSAKENGSVVVLLLPARPGTKWFQSYAFREGVERRWIAGRLKFGNPNNKGNSAPFDSILLIFRPWLGSYRWKVG